MELPPTIPDCLTLTEIYRLIYGKTSRPNRARLVYVIECLDLRPARVVGTVRLWHGDHVPCIQTSLAQVARREQGVDHAR